MTRRSYSIVSKNIKCSLAAIATEVLQDVNCYQYKVFEADVGLTYRGLATRRPPEEVGVPECWPRLSRTHMMEEGVLEEEMIMTTLRAWQRLQRS